MSRRQVVQGALIKQNVAKSSFHLVTYNNGTMKVCFLFGYASIATNLTKVVLFEVGLSGNLVKEVLLVFKVNYLICSKMEVSKFAFLS